MAKKPDRTKVAGIVVASGENARDFPPGTEVVGHLRSGAHATFITVPVAAIAQKPKTLTWEAAGGLFLAGATALDTLDALKIGADDTVVISARSWARPPAATGRALTGATPKSGSCRTIRHPSPTAPSCSPA